MTLTIGVWARRALCRFARPFPRPGPRCSKVAAGLSAIRAYPSAAPVTTPSKRPSTPRISGTVSSAATKCISDVPGLEKHTSTPASPRVRIRACAPFIVLAFVAVRRRDALVKENAGVEDSLGVEAVLDASHQLDLRWVLELPEVFLLGVSDSVLAGNRAAQSHADGEDVVQELVPFFAVL